MKVIGINGYKKSGKTTLLLNLAQEFKERGYEVAAIKHLSEDIGLDKGDTGKYKVYIPEFAALTEQELIIHLKNNQKLEEVLNFFKADIVLIEGFKQEKTFPKVICLRKEEEKEELFDGLQLCTASFSPLDSKDKLTNFNIMNKKDLGRMADLIWQRAFKLPNLNCKACGYPNCYELAKEIVQGRKNLKDCVILKSKTILKLNNSTIYLNPFVEKLLINTIRGFLSSLKGYNEGSIEIKIEKKK